MPVDLTLTKVRDDEGSSATGCDTTRHGPAATNARNVSAQCPSNERAGRVRWRRGATDASSSVPVKTRGILWRATVIEHDS